MTARITRSPAPRASPLGDRPGVRAVEEGAQVALALALDRGADLLVHEILVDGPVDRAEDPERHRAGGLPRQPRERERKPGIVAAGVVAEQAADRGIDDLECPVGRASARRVSPQRTSSPALQVEPVLLLLADDVEGAVVVDVAVLEDLDERGAAVRRGGPQHVGGPCLSVSIARATNVASAPIATESGLNGWSTEPSGVDFVTLPRSDVGRVLALRQPVDPVVEEQDRDVDVPAQRVDQVVAADRERVAVARHDPDGEVGPGGREPGRDRGRAPVDRVQAVRLDVVREPRGAPDARHEHEVLARDRRARAGTTARRRGSRSRRTRGTSAPPGRT